MRKKLLYGVCVLFLMALVCAVVLFNNTSDWSKKDFCIYDQNGKVIENLHECVGYLHVSLGQTHCDQCRDDTSKGMTYKGVMIGDDAIDSLSKYNLEGAYVHTGTSDWYALNETDIEKTISENEKVSIYLWFDDKYKSMGKPEDFTYKYDVTFFIEEGKIAEYTVKEMIKK